MKFYLKWSALILGPFALAVGGFIWWTLENPDGYSRDQLDSDYNREQVNRLMLERRDKERLEERWQKNNRAGAVEK